VVSSEKANGQLGSEVPSMHRVADLPLPRRVQRLRDALLAEPRVVSVDQACLVTQSYR
jgi:hypothetical protein